ncbi:unnamed protein product [Phaedon cochleariae]|uniref:Cyclin-like domain-containing protein n=1 Tax=Phaedon cochleariae TaxID=80249 RepID=A0A9P0DII4_PHACE|nr:unnamed protein product [Phaedon cochleariae]
MSTFRIYKEDKNLETYYDRKSSFKANEKAKVLQDLQVNRQNFRFRSPEKKILNVPIDKSKSKPKSADDVRNHGKKFLFEGDNGQKKETAKRKSIATSSGTKKLGTVFSSETVEILAKNVSRRSRGFSSSAVQTNSIKEKYDDSCSESFLNEGHIFNTTSRLDIFHQNEHCYSPIPVNKFTAPYTLLLKKPERKRSPKLKRRKAELGCQRTTHVGDIYNEEYLEVVSIQSIELLYNRYFISKDIMCNFKSIETTITLPTGFLENFNPDKQIRAAIVNWMLGIQRTISLSEGEYYLAVNLVDQILARIAVPVNMYQLLAISTLWIANKYIGSNCFSGSDMIVLCNNAYVIRQLVEMERKVLRIMNFQLHSLEPTICVNFYLKILDIDHLEIAKFSVYYILDCSTLLPEYSTVPITVLTAAALNVAFKIYCEDLEEMVDQFFNKNMSAAYVKQRKIMESQMYSLILNMTNEKYMFREAFYKYQSVHKYVLFL